MLLCNVFFSLRFIKLVCLFIVFLMHLIAVEVYMRFEWLFFAKKLGLLRIIRLPSWMLNLLCEPRGILFLIYCIYEKIMFTLNKCNMPSEIWNMFFLHLNMVVVGLCLPEQDCDASMNIGSLHEYFDCLVVYVFVFMMFICSSCFNDKHLLFLKIDYLYNQSVLVVRINCKLYHLWFFSAGVGLVWFGELFFSAGVGLNIFFTFLITIGICITGHSSHGGWR